MVLNLTLFFYKNSVSQAQVGIFLFFCQFKAEIFLWPFLEDREEYA